MAGVNKRKISKSNIEQHFNLRKILGYAPSQRQKEMFFDLVADKMFDRTTSGKDINNRKFPSYTKEYANKKGVTRDSVDLVLSGDMLTSFKESTTRDKVILKMEKDQAGKAHGNITGSYGKSSGNSRKARDFFGFNSEKDIADVITKVDSAREDREERIDLAELRSSVAALELEFDGEN